MSRCTLSFFSESLHFHLLYTTGQLKCINNSFFCVATDIKSLSEGSHLARDDPFYEIAKHQIVEVAGEPSSGYEFLTLLNKNIDSFNKYYPLGRNLSYNHIPKSYQELLVFVWTQQNKSFDGMPWSISEAVKKSVTDFARIYITQPESEAILKQRFGDTYWSYLLFEAKN